MQINFSVTVNNEQVRGFIHLPKKMNSTTPFVIVSHGLTGNKYGSHNIWVDMSRRLEKRGIASARFDFRGNGDSDGLHEEMTVLREVSDFMAVYDYALQYSQNIILVGYSLGTIVTSIAAGQTDAKKVILIAPVTPKVFIELAPNMIPLAKDFVGEVFEFKEGFLIGRSFMQEIERLHFGGSLSEFVNQGGSVHIIRGSEDPFASEMIALEYKDMYHGSLDTIPQIGHDVDSQSASELLYSAIEAIVLNERG